MRLSHCNDSFIKEITSIISAGGSSEIKTIHGTDGVDYYVSIDNVSGTNWYMASFVKVSDVLAPLYKFIAISSVIAFIMVIAMAVVMLQVINTMITKPVSRLTDNITRISRGDFSVDIERVQVRKKMKSVL